MPDWHLSRGYSSTLYKNARIVDSDSDFFGDLLTNGEIISDFSCSIDCPADLVVDCGGHMLMPGVVDIHVHLRDPGMTSAEDIISGGKAAAAGGVTTVVCQPNTIPAIDSPLIVEYVKAASKAAYINIKMYGATTLNRQSRELTDMVALRRAGVCGFSDDGAPTSNSRLMRQAMAYSRELGVPIAQHAEDHELSCGGSMNEGNISFILGEKGITNLSEAVVVARDIIIAAAEKGLYHVMHVSTKEALTLIGRAKNDGVRVTAEVTPHHFLLDDTALLEHGCNAKMNPPLRHRSDVDAMIGCLKNGTINCIASDHAPHPHSSKERSLSCAAFGIIGLETLLPLSLELYHKEVLSLNKVVELLTSGPAMVIGANNIGRIARGMRADLALVDINEEYKVSVMASKSSNSPFLKRLVKGRVLRTVCGGSTCYTY